MPAFIAATYIVHYYHLHDLIPQFPAKDLQETALTKIYDQVKFSEISDITGVPVWIVQELNPSYKLGFIPSSYQGNNLVLPRNAMANFLNYIGRPDERLNQLVVSSIPAPQAKNLNDFVVSSHIVTSEDDLESIASFYHLDEEDLKTWNKLQNDDLRIGQHLMLFIGKRPTESLAYQAIKNVPFMKMEPISPPLGEAGMPEIFIPQTKIPRKYSSALSNKKGKYVYYKLKRRESLKDVVEKYPDVTIEELMELNDLNYNSSLSPGDRIKVKKR